MCDSVWQKTTPQGGDGPLGLVGGRGQDLGPDDLARLLVDADRVGEGPADIHPNSNRHAALLSSQNHCAFLTRK